jgi:Holliday junction resolvase RusA-like endonuclease
VAERKDTPTNERKNMRSKPPKGFENLVSGVTSILPGDLKRRPVTDPVTEAEIRHAAQYQPGSVAAGAILCATLEIWLPGTPIGKPRMTQRDKWQKRPAVMRYREWADRLRAEAGPVPPAETVMELRILAQFEPPPSWSKKKRVAAIGELHRQRPDLDNLAKAAVDALYPKDDSAIARLMLEKQWHWKSGIEIRIVYRKEPT